MSGRCVPPLAEWWHDSGGPTEYAGWVCLTTPWIGPSSRGPSGAFLAFALATWTGAGIHLSTRGRKNEKGGQRERVRTAAHSSVICVRHGQSDFSFFSGPPLGSCRAHRRCERCMNGAAEPSAPCFSPRRSSETAVRRVRASGMWEKTFALWGRCGKKGKVLLLSPRTRREELDTLGASSTKQRRPNCQHCDKRLNMNGEMPTQESSNERFDQRSHARLLLPKHCWTNPLPSRKDPESTGCKPREPVPPPTFPPSPSAGPAATWCSKVL
ncbi:hypothetical protein MRX96_004753 [Rhipicephalus microplus]